MAQSLSTLRKNRKSEKKKNPIKKKSVKKVKRKSVVKGGNAGADQQSGGLSQLNTVDDEKVVAVEASADTTKDVNELVKEQFDFLKEENYPNDFDSKENIINDLQEIEQTYKEYIYKELHEGVTQQGGNEENEDALISGGTSQDELQQRIARELSIIEEKIVLQKQAIELRKKQLSIIKKSMIQKSNNSNDTEVNKLIEEVNSSKLEGVQSVVKFTVKVSMKLFLLFVKLIAKTLLLVIRLCWKSFGSGYLIKAYGKTIMNNVLDMVKANYENFTEILPGTSRLLTSPAEPAPPPPPTTQTAQTVPPPPPTSDERFYTTAFEGAEKGAYKAFRDNNRLNMFYDFTNNAMGYIATGMTAVAVARIRAAGNNLFIQ